MNSPNFIFVSDLHGHPGRIAALSDFLDEHGWEVGYTDGHPYLWHPTQTLIFVGDAVDRGEWSVPLAYVLLSSHVHSSDAPGGQRVVYLRGNHEQKLIHYLTGRNASLRHGFDVTKAQIHDPGFAREVSFLRQHLPEIPFRFVGRSFIAVHAEWTDPFPDEQLSVYGSRSSRTVTIKDEVGREAQVPGRNLWWKEFSKRDDGRVVIFGHYHMKNLECTSPDEGLICLDHWEHDQFKENFFCIALVSEGAASAEARVLYDPGAPHTDKGGNLINPGQLYEAVKMVARQASESKQNS